MIPVLVFLAACGLLFFALVETAFSLLMRLPQRLEAERESDERRAHGLSRGSAASSSCRRASCAARCSSLVVVLLAQPIGTGFPGWLVLFGSGVG